MTNPHPMALISTPAEVAFCRPCDIYGVRYPGDVATFPHCPSCGSTDLEDTRSPFEVLSEAIDNADAPDLDPGLRLARRDVVDAVARIAAKADPDHCSDCAHHARYLPSGLLQEVSR